MHRFGLVILCVFICFLPAPGVSAQEQDPFNSEITYPAAGEAIRGSIAIMGNTVIDGFISWELTFGYESDTTGSWYLIAESDDPVEDDILTDWDTTTITDGIYHIRLTVYLEGDRRTHFILPGIRVRNYTPIETETLIPVLTTTPHTLTPQPSRTPTITFESTPVPDTPTPLPTNPIEVSVHEISESLIRGALGTLTGFLILGLYITVRKTIQK